MPVLNHRDYRSAKAQIAQLRRLLGPNRIIDDLTSHLSAEVAAARQEALKSELQRLETDVAAYEKLRGDQANDPEIDVDDLGLLPIIGRITRRLSQRELAERLGIKEQQIQRYESERYAGISLSRYRTILDALGIELHPRLVAPWNANESDRPKEEVRFQVTPELLREIRKRKWLDLPNGMDNHEAAALIDTYIQDAFRLSKGKSFHRGSPTDNSDAAATARTAWRARVLRTAEQRPKLKTKFNIADTDWLKQLVTLSVYPDGPLKAADLLREKGIIVVTEPHLSHSVLDGAAFLLSDLFPVIGLTLRHDRLDNFWFTLLHEIGHIFLHFNSGLSEGFLDNLDDKSEDSAESEADSFAQSYLLPDEVWTSSPARFSKSAQLIKNFAETRSVHPAIVAGRIRRDRNDYRMFDDLVGRGQVRRLFFPHIG